MVQLYSFACEYSVFPATFVEETVLSQCVVLAPLLKITWPRIQGFIWALFSVPLVYISVFMLVPHHLDFCCFVVYFEIVKYEASNFFLKIGFGYSESLEIPYEFLSIFFYVCVRCYWVFDKECIESVDCFG